MNRKAIWFIKLLVAVCCFLLLFRLVSPEEVFRTLSQLSIESIFWLLYVSVVLIFLSALKWHYFLEALGTEIRIIKLFGLYLVGYFVNLILPSYLGGDVVRSFYVGKKTGQHEALTATILERYTGLFAMLVLGVFFVWQVPFVTFEIKLSVVILFLGVIVSTIVALSNKVLEVVALLRLTAPLGKHIKQVQDGFKFALSNKRLLAKAFLISFVYHSLTVVNILFAADAVGWINPPIMELFVVLPLALIIGAIPISPSGLGIQEGALYFFLTKIGATPVQALGIGLVLRAKSYILALLGGVVWLYIRGGRKK